MKIAVLLRESPRSSLKSEPRVRRAQEFLTRAATHVTRPPSIIVTLTSVIDLPSEVPVFISAQMR